MRQGQSLFEVVFAIAIAALVVVTVVSLSNKSLGTTNSSADRSQASRYAQQITECLREQRDTNWENFLSDAGVSCVSALSTTPQFSTPIVTFECFDATDTLLPDCTPTPPTFVETVNAEVVVTWQDGSGTHEVNSVTQYTDWRRR